MHGGGHRGFVPEVHENGRGLVHADQRARDLAVERHHDERTVADLLANEARRQIECAAVRQGDDATRRHTGQGLRVERRSQGRHPGARTHHTRQHRDIRIHGRHRPPVRHRTGGFVDPGGPLRHSPAHRPGSGHARSRSFFGGGCEREEVVRLHPAGRRPAPDHEWARAFGDLGRGLRRDPDEVLVQRHLAQFVASVHHLGEPHDRVERQGRGPCDISGVGAERGRVREAGDVRHEFVPVPALRRDRDAVRRPWPTEFDDTGRVSAACGREEIDAVQVGCGPGGIGTLALGTGLHGEE